MGVRGALLQGQRHDEAPRSRAARPRDDYCYYNHDYYILLLLPLLLLLLVVVVVDDVDPLPFGIWSLL